MTACYCNVCGGEIVPVEGREWVCTICGEVSIADELADAVAFERGTFRMGRDPRDELDGGVR